MAKPKKTPEIQNLLQDAQALFNVLSKESDLACVLIAASYLNEILASILERYLIEDNISHQLISGALGTFARRADACFSLGLISKNLYKNLNTIAQIRNQFAHKYLLLTFADPEIETLVNSLSLLPVQGIVVEDRNTLDNLESFSKMGKDTRSIFNMAVALTLGQLLVLGFSTHGVSRKTGKSA